MSIFRRLWRMIRAMFGFAVDSIENPELILQQNIRDMNDQVPVMNQQLAEVLANKNLAETDLKKSKDQETDLKNKAQAALRAGRRDIAGQYALELEKLKPTITAKEATAKLAADAYANCENAKVIFIREKDKKIQAAKAALSHHKQAEWNDKIANTLANFQVASIGNTNDEMIQRLEEEAAKSQAKLEMALNDKQSGLAAVEADAEKIQADELLRQMEMDMGLSAPPSHDTTPREKSMGVRVKG